MTNHNRGKLLLSLETQVFFQFQNCVCAKPSGICGPFISGSCNFRAVRGKGPSEKGKSWPASGTITLVIIQKHNLSYRLAPAVKFSEKLCVASP